MILDRKMWSICKSESYNWLLFYQSSSTYSLNHWSIFVLKKQSRPYLVTNSLHKIQHIILFITYNSPHPGHCFCCLRQLHFLSVTLQCFANYAHRQMGFCRFRVEHCAYPFIHTRHTLTYQIYYLTVQSINKVLL